MHWRTFFFYNALGGISWAITFGLVGYFGGKAAAHVLAEVGIAGAVILGLLIVGLLVRARRRERARERAAHEPPASAHEEAGSS